MSELITAKQAFNEFKKNALNRKNNDLSKMNTIMKQIKYRSEKGFCYFDYQSSINYAIAKTLTDLGYKMYRFRQDMIPVTIDDFKVKGMSGIRIDWSAND